MHAQTIGRTSSRAGLSHIPVSVVEHWQQVKDAVTQLGLPTPPDGVDQDVAEIARILGEPGAYLALSSGDPSVVNCKVIRDKVRFFDFEAACFRHALVDAAVLRFLYPTGGPAWYLPPKIARRIEAAYRQELALGYSAAADARYEAGMAAACAAWAIVRMARLPRVDVGPDRNSWTLLPSDWSGPIPTRSRRRQLVSIVETCVASAHQARTLGAFTDWCAHIIDALRLRWPEATEEMPLYPVFR